MLASSTPLPPTPSARASSGYVGTRDEIRLAAITAPSTGTAPLEAGMLAAEAGGVSIAVVIVAGGGRGGPPPTPRTAPPLAGLGCTLVGDEPVLEELVADEPIADELVAVEPPPAGWDGVGGAAGAAAAGGVRL